MPVIMKENVKYAYTDKGIKAHTLSYAEYQALSTEEKMNGDLYFIPDKQPEGNPSLIWDKLGTATLDTDADNVSDAVNELNSSLNLLKWGADIINFSKTSLSAFQSSYDSAISTSGIRFGYIGASDSQNIGLPNQGHYCVLMANSMNYRIIVTISSNGDRIKMCNKVNGTWTSAWKNVSLT